MPNDGPRRLAGRRESRRVARRGAPNFGGAARDAPSFGAVARAALVAARGGPSSFGGLARAVETARRDILISAATSTREAPEPAARRVPVDDLRDGGETHARGPAAFVHRMQSEFDKFTPPGARPVQNVFVSSTMMWRDGEECYYREQFERFTLPNRDPVQEARVTTSTDARDFSPA